MTYQVNMTCTPALVFTIEDRCSAIEGLTGIKLHIVITLKLFACLLLRGMEV